MSQQSSSQQSSSQKPSDIPAAKGYANSLTGSLPTGKRRRSPFDRIGSQQWQPEKGQVSKSYA